METLLKSITRIPHGTTIAEVISGAGEGEEVSVVFKAVHKKSESQSPCTFQEIICVKVMSTS